jgi:hypothetical protein
LVDLHQSVNRPRTFEHRPDPALLRQAGDMQAQVEEEGFVYVIDDDPHVRSGLSNLLRSVGLNAQVFGSATEFLRLERLATPSCVILDVRNGTAARPSSSSPATETFR